MLQTLWGKTLGSSGTGGGGPRPDTFIHLHTFRFHFLPPSTLVPTAYCLHVLIPVCVPIFLSIFHFFILSTLCLENFLGSKLHIFFSLPQCLPLFFCPNSFLFALQVSRYFCPAGVSTITFLLFHVSGRNFSLLIPVHAPILTNPKFY